jgi:hypothetical protein
VAEETRTCELEGCDRQIEPGAPSTKRYCTEDHQRTAGRRRRRAAADALGVRTGEPDLDAALTAAEDRDRAQEHSRQLRQLTASESRLRRYEAVLERSIRSHEPTPLVRPPHGIGERLPTHEWIVELSDWHIGQKTRIEETGGMYYQDMATTRHQVAKLWEGLQRLHAIESSGRKIDVLHILSLGDLIDNDDLRPSQHRKVEEVMTVQTIQAFDLLAWFVRQALTIFTTVEVDLVGGNHDRMGRHKGDGGLGELDYIDTVSYLVGAFLERALADDIAAGRLKVKNWQTFFGYKEVAGQRVVFEHGSSFKWGVGSYGGVPWYGIQRAGAGYESMLGGADIVCLGHGHRPAIIPNGRGWICVNGALPATSSYAQSSFKSIGRPLQWLLSVHHEMGLTGWLPLYADVEGALLPGDIWLDPEGHSLAATRPRTVEGVE